MRGRTLKRWANVGIPVLLALRWLARKERWDVIHFNFGQRRTAPPPLCVANMWRAFILACLRGPRHGLDAKMILRPQ